MAIVRRKTKYDRTDKQKLLDSNIKKKCNRCKKKKYLRDFQLKQEYGGRWYPLYVCKSCQSVLKNEKRKDDSEYKIKHKLRGKKRWIEGREKLKDFYVESTLHLKTPYSETVKKYPELIKAKRVILKIKKMIEDKNELQE